MGVWRLAFGLVVENLVGRGSKTQLVAGTSSIRDYPSNRLRSMAEPGVARHKQIGRAVLSDGAGGHSREFRN